VRHRERLPQDGPLDDLVRVQRRKVGGAGRVGGARERREEGARHPGDGVSVPEATGSNGGLARKS